MLDPRIVFERATSPLEKVALPLLDQKGVALWFKRDDLLHPILSGNKWRKLKYNILTMGEAGHKGMLTFGGAFSNHLHAVAGAGKIIGFPTVGIVRGERPTLLSPTLQFCEAQGMRLHFVSRLAYQQKEQSVEVKAILSHYMSHLLIPEGGANELALKGCAEIVEEISVPFDYLAVACGTGTTFHGLAGAMPKGSCLLGFPVLKGMEQFIDQQVAKDPATSKAVTRLLSQYHFGGYAKWDKPLLQFIRSFENETGIKLDQVYTGKLVFGVMDLISKDYFKSGDRIVVLHTGGLQGRLPELDRPH